MVTLKPYMRCINKIVKKFWLLLPFFVMPDMSTWWQINYYYLLLYIYIYIYNYYCLLFLFGLSLKCWQGSGGAKRKFFTSWHAQGIVRVPWQLSLLVGKLKNAGFEARTGWRKIIGFYYCTFTILLGHEKENQRGYFTINRREYYMHPAHETSLSLTISKYLWKLI